MHEPYNNAYNDKHNVFLIILFDSPGRLTTKLFCAEYDVKIDLCVLELSQHHHRKIHLHALPLWTHRLLIVLSGAHMLTYCKQLEN